MIFCRLEVFGFITKGLGVCFLVERVVVVGWVSGSKFCDEGKGMAFNLLGISILAYQLSLVPFSMCKLGNRKSVSMTGGSHMVGDI